MTDLSHSDVDVIRPPNPRLTRMALGALAIIAAGSFASGLAHQVVGPLLVAAPAEDPAHAAIAQARPLAPTVQPAMQVAATEPARRPPPKLDVPDPEPAPPATPPSPALAAAPTTEPPAEAPAPPAVDAVAAPSDAPADPPTTDSTDPPAT